MSNGRYGESDCVDLSECLRDQFFLNALLSGHTSDQCHLGLLDIKLTEETSELDRLMASTRVEEREPIANDQRSDKAPLQTFWAHLTTSMGLPYCTLIPLL